MALRPLRWLGIALLVIGYAMLAHHTNQTADSSPLGLWLAVAPLIAIAALLAWRATRRWLMLSLVALLCVAIGLAWPTLTNHYGTLYWLQHVGTQLILLVVFGRTLVGGQEPLCTRFARMAHAPLVLSANHQRYTRRVTLAWAVFFAIMAIVSTGLFLGTSMSTWSFFANFLTLPLVALVFVIEYRVRTWALPNVPPIPILEGVRAFQKAGERLE